MRGINSLYFIQIVLALIIIGLSSCKNCEDQSKKIKVRIFIEHDRLEIIPPVFERVTEQVLVKDSHRVGAKFESLTEQILLQEGFTLYKISEHQTLSIVSNTDEFNIDTIPCIKFYDESDVEKIEIPDIYKTRTYQRLFEDGTGAVIPAEYDFHVSERLIDDAQLIIRTEEQREFIEMTFVIPDDISFDDYLERQLLLQEIDYCLQAGSYQIIN